MDAYGIMRCRSAALCNTRITPCKRLRFVSLGIILTNTKLTAPPGIFLRWNFVDFYLQMSCCRSRHVYLQQNSSRGINRFYRFTVTFLKWMSSIENPNSYCYLYSWKSTEIFKAIILTSTALAIRFQIFFGIIVIIISLLRVFVLE